MSCFEIEKGLDVLLTERHTPGSGLSHRHKGSVTSFHFIFSGHPSISFVDLVKPDLPGATTDMAQENAA